LPHPATPLFFKPSLICGFVAQNGQANIDTTKYPTKVLQSCVIIQVAHCAVQLIDMRTNASRHVAAEGANTWKRPSVSDALHYIVINAPPLVRRNIDEKNEVLQVPRRQELCGKRASGKQFKQNCSERVEVPGNRNSGIEVMETGKESSGAA
jgi:hypothetical protein